MAFDKVINEMGKINYKTKPVLLTLTTHLPFFFVALYLFAPKQIELVSTNLLSDLNFWFIISLCFAISITWIAVNWVYCFISIFIQAKSEGDDLDFSLILIITKAYSLLRLSSVILICYVFKTSFFIFLMLLFGWALIHLLRVVLFNFKTLRSLILS